MNDHMHIHSIDGTCLICGEVNSRVRASWRLSHPTPPTQENELDLDTWFEGRDEQMVNARIELLKKIVGMSQNKEKPTQEKELCEHCGEPLPFKPPQEIGSKGGWAGGIGTMIPKEEKGLTYDEAIYLGKAMSEKPTQDTESWEEELWKIQSDSLPNAVTFDVVALKMFIARKLGEEMKKRNFMRSVHDEQMAKEVVKAYTLGVENGYKTAHTQGAEAAVRFFIENKYLFVEGKEFYETSFERVCEKAKKV